MKQSKLKNDIQDTYKMLLTFLEQHQAVCAVLLDSDNCDHCSLMPSTQEFTIIEELVLMLKPFNDATEVVSGEKYPTISIITPLIHKLLNVLKETSEDSTLTKQIKSTIHLTNLGVSRTIYNKHSGWQHFLTPGSRHCGSWKRMNKMMLSDMQLVSW